jgi:hypothetical protein
MNENRKYTMVSPINTLGRKYIFFGSNINKRSGRIKRI